MHQKGFELHQVIRILICFTFLCMRNLLFTNWQANTCKSKAQLQNASGNVDWIRKKKTTDDASTFQLISVTAMEWISKEIIIKKSKIVSRTLHFFSIYCTPAHRFCLCFLQGLVDVVLFCFILAFTAQHLTSILLSFFFLLSFTSRCLLLTCFLLFCFTFWCLFVLCAKSRRYFFFLKILNKLVFKGKEVEIGRLMLFVLME